jgi:hypothetical protein
MTDTKERILRSDGAVCVLQLRDTPAHNSCMMVEEASLYGSNASLAANAPNLSGYPAVAGVSSPRILHRCVIHSTYTSYHNAAA